MTPFVTRRRVEFADTDMAGIVHFANFYRWMEEAEHEWFRSLGLQIMNKPVRDPETGEDYVVGWPRVSAKCSFEKPGYHEDVLEIEFSLQRVGFKSLSFDVEFFTQRAGERVRLAKGHMKTACCKCRRDGSLESVPIPEDYLAKMQPDAAGR